MNVNSQVITALTSLSIPVAADVYEGAADEYITFNYATIEAALEKEKSDKIEKIQREAFEQDKQAKISQRHFRY